MELWLDVKEIGTGLSESVNFKYVLTTDENSCTTNLVSSGNFYGTTTDSKVNILEGKSYNTSKNDEYYLYIWLDAAEESQTTMNQSLNLSLNLFSIPVIPVVKNGAFATGLLGAPT